MNRNLFELLNALSSAPLSVKEIKTKFSKTEATLYRTIQTAEEDELIEKIEGFRYALTEKGRRLLDIRSWFPE